MQEFILQYEELQREIKQMKERFAKITNGHLNDNPRTY